MIKKYKNKQMYYMVIMWLIMSLFVSDPTQVPFTSANPASNTSSNSSAQQVKQSFFILIHPTVYTLIHNIGSRKI